MKKILVLILSLIALNSFAKSECQFKADESTGVTYLLPIYGAKVFYYFDDNEQKAMAQVQWNFDEVATSNCLKNYQGDQTTKMSHPELDFPELQIEVFHGLEKAPLSVLPQLGGQFHGQTDFIPVNYRFKDEIIKRINQKGDLLTVHGKLQYLNQLTKRDVIAEFDCVKGSETKGVMALYSRLGLLIQKINSFDINKKINRDHVLENFMGSCVGFEKIETNDLVGFSRKVKLLKSKIPVFGEVKFSQKETFEAVQLVESYFTEY